MNKDQKKKIVAEFQDRFARSTVAIVTDYKGLNVKAMNGLRNLLREVDVEFRVAKNTLLIQASADNDMALLKDYLKGPIAIALSYEDPVAPAKVLTEFAEKNDKLEIKAGVMQGKVLNLDAITALASLPSREVLLGQLLSVMIGVPTSFVRTLSAIPQKMVNVLTALKDQREAAEG